MRQRPCAQPSWPTSWQTPCWLGIFSRNGPGLALTSPIPHIKLNGAQGSGKTQILRRDMTSIGKSATATPNRVPFTAAERSIVHVLRRRLADMPDKPWLVFEDLAVTYRDADRLSNRLANGLRGAGVSPGDTLLVMLPDGLDLVLLVARLCQARRDRGPGQHRLSRRHPGARHSRLPCPDHAGLFTLSRSAERCGWLRGTSGDVSSKAR